MPVTIKQLKEFLNKFPDDTEVRVLKAEDKGMFENYTDLTWENIRTDGYDVNVEFTDFTDIERYPWLNDGKHDHVKGKKFLDFGEKN